MPLELVEQRSTADLADTIGSGRASNSGIRDNRRGLLPMIDSSGFRKSI